MLIKHERFNIYGMKSEVEALQDTIIAENEIFVENLRGKMKFEPSIGQYEYWNCGKYNGKILQLLFGNREIKIIYDGQIIGDLVLKKSTGCWTVYMYEHGDMDRSRIYTGKKGVRGCEVILHAIMNDDNTMYETYIDAIQYYWIQQEPIHHEYLGKYITLKFTEGNEGIYEMKIKDSNYCADVFYDFDTKKYSVHDGVDGYGWHDTIYKAVERYIDCEYGKNHEEYYVPKCRKCGDGGCWYCEPYRFL